MFASMGFMEDNAALGSVIFIIYNFGLPLPIIIQVICDNKTGQFEARSHPTLTTNLSEAGTVVPFEAAVPRDSVSPHSTINSSGADIVVPFQAAVPRD
jgi:hypothetical protein